jgi:hypothetical protein
MIYSAEQCHASLLMCEVRQGKARQGKARDSNAVEASARGIGSRYLGLQSTLANGLPSSPSLTFHSLILRTHAQSHIPFRSHAHQARRDHTTKPSFSHINYRHTNFYSNSIADNPPPCLAIIRKSHSPLQHCTLTPPTHNPISVPKRPLLTTTLAI